MSRTVVLERVQKNAAGTASIDNSRLSRQRVYIFPTAQGWVYGLMLIVMLLGAINYSNSMAFMLCFLLAGLGITCMLYTYRNLAGLLVTSTRPEAVFAGQTALFPIQFDNQAGQDRFAIKVRQKPGKRSKSKPAGKQTSIVSGEQSVLFYPVQTARRGRIKAGRVIIETQFPLGIFRAWSNLDIDESGVVYPRPSGEKRLPAYAVSDEDAEVGKATGTDDFAGFRKYRPGDATRSIAWKAYAREQGLLVKQFSGKGSETLILSWQHVAHVQDIESRLSQLCLWLLMAEETGIQYGLQLPGIEIGPGSGEQHRQACLEKLALFGDGNERA